MLEMAAPLLFVLAPNMSSSSVVKWRRGKNNVGPPLQALDLLVYSDTLIIQMQWAACVVSEMPNARIGTIKEQPIAQDSLVVCCVILALEAAAGTVERVL